MGFRFMRVVIIGAGVSGLSMGAALAKAGVEVTILDKSSTVAGLAASFTRNNCVFDLGPHIFFGKKVNPELAKFFDITNVIVENRNLKRGIYIHGNYFSYPLRLKEILKRLEKKKVPKVILEVAAGNLLRSNDQHTVEGWVKGKIGKVLFDYIELDTYVRKLYGIPASETSSDWSKHRLKPLANLNLWGAVNASLNPWAKKKKRYMYYCPAGIGQIADNLANYVTANGGEILLDSSIEKTVVRDGRVVELLVEENGKQRAVSGDFYVSSAKISDLVRMIEPKASPEVLDAADSIRYRDLIILYMVVDRAKLLDHCLVYFSTKGTLFKRITEFKHFSQDMAPKSVTSLAMEICVNQGDEIWGYEDKQIFEMVIKETEELNMLKRQEVMEYFTVRIPAVYPVYFLYYERHLEILLNCLMGVSNLISIGRGGLYQHDNMPTAIQSALDVAKLITSDSIRKPGMINEIVYGQRLRKYRNVS